MEVKLIQTADPFVYYEMFAATSRANRQFSRMHNLDYLGYIGLRMGCFPWHATFNRIPLLRDAVNQGYRGWILYLDADAYIADMQFDIRAFLGQHSAYSMIAAPGGVEHWCINAGIFLLNLGTEFGRSVIEKWNAAFEHYVGVEALCRAETPWQTGIRDDQVLLHQVLSQLDHPRHLLVLPLTEIGAPTSKRIRQILRQHGSLTERQFLATRDVDAILRPL